MFVVGIDAKKYICSAPFPAPYLYGGNRESELIVIEDFGDEPRLDHAFLGQDTMLAEKTVIALFQTIGRMQAQTIGQVAYYLEIRAALGSAPQWITNIGEIGAWDRQHMKFVLKAFGVQPQTGFYDEQEVVWNTVKTPGPFTAYIHSDARPDNCHWVGDELRLLVQVSSRAPDFEALCCKIEITGRRMKGLKIAKDFYSEWGREYLELMFPELVKRVAIGRISGSDVIGADDEISKDHNWGPQFTLFLSAEDYAEQGEKLSEVMNAAAPNPWKGYRLGGAGNKSVKVESIPDWIGTWIGFSEKPSRNEDWGIIVKERIDGGINEARESILYFLRHGAIWYDGSGELSSWREALRYYPEKVWFIRLAEELFRVFQHGEYNFVQRVAKRNDPIAKAICVGEFVNGVMRVLLLLNGDYTPYWKWLAHEFRKLEQAQTYAPLLEELVSVSTTKKQIEIVLKICGEIHQMMKNGGFITGENDNKYLLPLFNAHLELLAKGKGD